MYIQFLNDLADKLYVPGKKEIEELKEIKKVRSWMNIFINFIHC